MFVSDEQCSSSNPPGPLRSAYRVLVVVFVADLMDMVDSTVASLAGPSIRTDLGGNETLLQWVLAAYTVTFALGLVTAGRLGDLVGRRRLFLLGMAGFTVFSLACGVAPGVGWLVAARALQGLFGSLMIPQGFALLTVVFPPHKLRQAFVPFGPLMGLAAVGGPILAGWLLHLNLFGSQWRSIFLINVPIGVLAWILSWRCLPRHTGEDRAARLDVTGVSLLTLASGLLIVPLVEGRELGWPSWCYVMVAASVVLLALFVISERRSAHPVITPTLFHNRSFVVGLVVVAGFFAAQSGFLLVLNLLLQLGMGWTPLQTGMALIPWAVGSALGVGLSGANFVAKLGRRTLQFGFACAATGLLVFCWTIAVWENPFTAMTFAPGLLLIGFGTGMVGVPIFEYVLGDTSTEEVGTGSGMLNAIQQFASAIGVAALGTVFFAQANRYPTAGYEHAGVLVGALTAALFLVTLLLVGLLPRQPRHTGTVERAEMPTKVALITGVSRQSGIGFAVAEQLADRGYHVILTARDRLASQHLADQLGHAATALRLDLTEPATFDDVATFIEQTFGHLDVLINNATAGPDFITLSALDIDTDALRTALEVDVVGPWGLTLALLPLLEAAPAARIVNVSSGAAQQIAAGLDLGAPMRSPAYSTGKYMLNVLTAILAHALEATPILVNAVDPGPTATHPERGDEDDDRPVTESAGEIVWAATLDGNGPSGCLFHHRQRVGSSLVAIGPV